MDVDEAFAFIHSQTRDMKRSKTMKSVEKEKLTDTKALSLVKMMYPQLEKSDRKRLLDWAEHHGMDQFRGVEGDESASPGSAPWFASRKDPLEAGLALLYRFHKKHRKAKNIDEITRKLNTHIDSLVNGGSSQEKEGDSMWYKGVKYTFSKIAETAVDVVIRAATHPIDTAKDAAMIAALAFAYKHRKKIMRLVREGKRLVDVVRRIASEDPRAVSAVENSIAMSDRLALANNAMKADGVALEVRYETLVLGVQEHSFQYPEVNSENAWLKEHWYGFDSDWSTPFQQTRLAKEAETALTKFQSNVNELQKVRDELKSTKTPAELRQISKKIDDNFPWNKEEWGRTNKKWENLSDEDLALKLDRYARIGPEGRTPRERQTISELQKEHLFREKFDLRDEGWLKKGWGEDTPVANIPTEQLEDELDRILKGGPTHRTPAERKTVDLMTKELKYRNKFGERSSIDEHEPALPDEHEPALPEEPTPVSEPVPPTEPVEPKPMKRQL
jgi:hypothetical protein